MDHLAARHPNLATVAALLARQGGKLHLNLLLLQLLLTHLLCLPLSFLRLLRSSILQSASLPIDLLSIQTLVLVVALLLLELGIDIRVGQELDFHRILLLSHLNDCVWNLHLGDLLSFGDRHVLVDLLGLDLLYVLLVWIITHN